VTCWSSTDAAKALKKGAIDLFIDDSPMIWYLAGVNEAQGLDVAPMIFSDEVLAWAMRPSDTQLRDSVNAFLKKATASGELNQTIRRWIPKFQ